MEEMNTGAVATTESISATPEPATVFGFAPEAPAAAEQEPAAVENENNSETEEPATPSFETEKQRNAFAAQRDKYKSEMAKLRNDPAMQVGEQLIRDVMRQEECDREAAVKTINQRFVDAYAKRENVGQDAARKLMNMHQETEITPEQEAQGIVDELMNTKIPDGFDMDAAMQDGEFQQLLVEYPPSAAIRIYQAEQKANKAPQAVADRLRARQGVPASTRPSQSVTPEPNFANMSSADFFAYKERAAKSMY